MKYMKQLGISLLYMFIPLFLILFILTLFNYIGLINYKVFSILRFILLISVIIIGGFKKGKTSNTKGIVEGIKYGLIIILIFIIINIIINNPIFTIKQILYYGIILGSSIIGNIIGVNKKIKE